MQTEITVKDGRKLIVVEVPKEASHFATGGNTLMHTMPGKDPILTGQKACTIKFKNNVSLIGTLHYNPEPVFDFDTEQFVEKHVTVGYKNYGAQTELLSTIGFKNHTTAFLSLLHSYGIGFKENPLGEKPINGNVKYGIYDRGDVLFDETLFENDLYNWKKGEEGILHSDKQYVFIEVK